MENEIENPNIEIQVKEPVDSDTQNTNNNINNNNNNINQENNNMEIEKQKELEFQEKLITELRKNTNTMYIDVQHTILSNVYLNEKFEKIESQDQIDHNFKTLVEKYIREYGIFEIPIDLINILNYKLIDEKIKIFNTDQNTITIRFKNKIDDDYNYWNNKESTKDKLQMNIDISVKQQKPITHEIKTFLRNDLYMQMIKYMKDRIKPYKDNMDSLKLYMTTEKDTPVLFVFLLPDQMIYIVIAPVIEG